MKNILYVLTIIMFTACSQKKAEPVQGFTATPNGLAGLQSQNVTTPASSNGIPSNLILNPEHGQPGHDCNLAVGAPLKGNSVANQQAQPIANQQAVTANVPQPLVNNTKVEKLNPAHGQSGHDCGIAVGAPLNSKTVSVKSQSKGIGAKAEPVMAENESKKALNPAHGQPNHRCDIAVGAPLT